MYSFLLLYNNVEILKSVPKEKNSAIMQNGFQKFSVISYILRNE